MSKRVFTEEHKKKISNAMKNRKVTWGYKVSETKKRCGTVKGINNPMYGKHHSEETKRKISENKERSKKISDKLKGVNTWSKGRISEKKGKSFEELYGDQKSKEIKEKIGKYSRGNKNSNWSGGRTKNNGYIKIFNPNHPNSINNYVFEHRLVVENYIGRYLKPEEVVHHIDFCKTNNNINNLMLFKNSNEHIKFHIKIRQFGLTNPIKRQIENRWQNIE
jgi:hypothetical protein